MHIRFITSGMVLVAALAAAAHGRTTWHVDDDNCPGPGSGTQADPFCSIQAGINAAGAGDGVVVAPGTYYEEINFDGKAITLRSSGGPAVTTIDGQGGGTVVTCASGEGLGTVLEGLTITGGYSSHQGGGMSNRGSSPTVTNCTFNGKLGSCGGPVIAKACADYEGRGGGRTIAAV